LIDDMKQAGFRVSRATVYRTLAKLVDAGLLRRLEMGPRMFYEHDYGYPQHEHLYCGKCGKVIEFQEPAIDSVLRDVCRQHNFQISNHTFIVRGTCAECNRARVTKRRLDLV
jgi:Fur family ferric uptake transcriptional regulator